MSQSIKLSNGVEQPIIGLGTWQDAVISAVICGYRLIDCAFVYGNEAGVGEALEYLFKNNIVKREDLFIVTKLWNSHHDPKHSMDRCKISLKNLKLDYVDLYLIHWPVGYEFDGDNIEPKNSDGTIKFHDYGLSNVWAGMEKIQREGLAKSIGISNFNIRQIEEIYDKAEIKPVINQIEVSALFPNIELVKYCQEKNIQVMAYSPFGNPGNSNNSGEISIFELEHIIALGKKYKKSPAQICIKFCLQLKCICIPKSVTEVRIKENYNVFDFMLDDNEIKEIIDKSPNRRFCHARSYMGPSKEYPFND